MRKTVETNRSASKHEITLYMQKWTLQRRNSQGLFVQVATFDRPISPQEVESEFGPGYYVLRSTKPRFQTTWKAQLGKADHSESLVNNHQLAIQKLQRNEKILGLGIGVTGAVEAISLPLIHFRFVKLEGQIAEVKAALGTLSAAHLQCPNCGSRLVFLLQPNCRICKAPLIWPKEAQQLQPKASEFQG